jgi:Cytochrome oxidase complex assembly protein 1
VPRASVSRKQDEPENRNVISPETISRTELAEIARRPLAPGGSVPQADSMQTQNQEQPSSWLGRNWKWLVPLGCLTSVVALFAFVAAIVLVVFGFMKSSDVYQHAVETSRSSQAVVEALGEPIEPGWYMTGTINVSGTSGKADISIPISGPKGTGTLYAVATKRAGAWNYEVLEVELATGGERIDLRGD